MADTNTSDVLSSLDLIVESAGAAPAAQLTPSVPIVVAPAAVRSQVPTVGRIVHFHEYADVECLHTVHRAALIVHVWSATCVNLVVYGQNGDPKLITSASISTAESVAHRGTAAGTWAWPERV